MRFEHFWHVHFLVAKLRLTQNLRLQLELHELFHAFPLHENLWSFFVNRDAQFIFLCKKKRVLLRRKLEPEIIEPCAQLRRLLLREWMGVWIHFRFTFLSFRAKSRNLLLLSALVLFGNI